jgi:hypothetical protein
VIVGMFRCVPHHYSPVRYILSRDLRHFFDEYRVSSPSYLDVSFRNLVCDLRQGLAGASIDVADALLDERRELTGTRRWYKGNY